MADYVAKVSVDEFFRDYLPGGHFGQTEETLTAQKNLRAGIKVAKNKPGYNALLVSQSLRQHDMPSDAH